MDVGVVGLGLIGGSIALNLAQGLSVGGYDTDPSAIDLALSKGAIERGCHDLRDLGEAKLVFVATPPGSVIPTLQSLSKTARPDMVITDCAGVKGPLISDLLARDVALKPRFVGGHPMAGKERGGMAEAVCGLFEGAPWILTPTAETDADALEMVAGTVATFGANPILMTPEEHDRAVALVSHLPHVLAALLVEMAGGDFEIGAGSWRDMTRVAGADPKLWGEILTANRKAVLSRVRTLSAELSTFAEKLEAGDRGAIERYFEEARKAREDER